jgi:hypothetical protein
MTPSQAFESTLALGSDAFPLRGKLLVSSSTLTTTPSSILELVPSSLGARSSALSLIYGRYRFKYLRFKFLPFAPAGTGVEGPGAVLGILDDATTAEGDGPTSVSGVLEQRCSAICFSGQTIPVEFSWRPNDPSMWYYTASGASGSDNRLISCGVLYGAAAVGVSTAATIEIDFSIVFKGAIDVSST